MHSAEPAGVNVRLHKFRIIRNHAIERKSRDQSAIFRPASTLGIRMLWRINFRLLQIYKIFLKLRSNSSVSVMQWHRHICMYACVGTSFFPPYYLVMQLASSNCWHFVLGWSLHRNEGYVVDITIPPPKSLSTYHALPSTYYLFSWVGAFSESQSELWFQTWLLRYLLWSLENMEYQRKRGFRICNRPWQIYK